MSNRPKTIPYSPEPARGWLPWGLLAPFICIAIVVIPVLATSDWLDQGGFTDARGDPIGTQGLLAFLGPPFALTGLLLLAWVMLVERRPLATIGLTRPGGLKAFLGGIGIGCLSIGAIVTAIWIEGGYRADGFGLAFGSPADLANIGLLFLAFVLQASVEEIVFRGWLLSAVARKLNVPVAVVVTGVVFCLLHYGPGQPWLSMLTTFLFSTFACLWALRSGNIWGVMGWHAGWNWLLATGFELPVTGFDAGTAALLVKLIPQGPAYLTGGSVGPEGSWLCAAFFVLASLWLLRPQKPGRRAPSA